jgi:hypothetical protein
MEILYHKELGDVYAENLYSTSAISGSSLSLAGGITLAGNISVGGTVDGIDIATDVAQPKHIKDWIY